MSRKETLALLGRSSARLKHLINIDAPELLIEQELNLLARHTARWREEAFKERYNLNDVLVRVETSDPDSDDAAQ